MRFNLIPSFVCPNCGRTSELPGGDLNDPVRCEKCGVTPHLSRKDLRLLTPEQFEAATKDQPPQS